MDIGKVHRDLRKFSLCRAQPSVHLISQPEGPVRFQAQQLHVRIYNEGEDGFSDGERGAERY